MFSVQPRSAGALRETQQLVQRYAAQQGIALRSSESPPVQDTAPESARAELSVLQRVERALLEARELSADLHEAAALRVLSGAEQELLGALSLPGVHGFLAEVYVQLALCAAQLSEDGLFESALSRALSLDPSRRIEAAEAPPAILERARALARSRDLAPISEGRVRPEPQTALAWLDGVRLSSSDLTFRARAGLHLLVVRAAGFAPYATLLSLEAGKRPALTVQLAELAGESARRALNEARGPEQREKQAVALARARSEAVYLFEVAGSPHGRALVRRCHAQGCAEPRGLATTGRDPPTFADSGAAQAWLHADTLAAASKRTTRQTPTQKEKPLWKRWPLWAGSAALLLAGGATAIWATRPAQDPAQRSLEVDARALPR
jgi:hypothetical protein